MIWMQEMYTRASIALRSLRDREEGQGLAEYALILVLVAIVAIVVLEILGTDITDVFTDVETELDGTAGS
jgi:pilus assembly protein Flp/PilA